MLSILIPTYNYNCYSLVEELKTQADKLNIEYEIIVQDDFSTLYFDENSKINSLEKCRFVVNTQNLGRAKNRNKLVENAKYFNLLFLDSDTFPTSSRYISNYLNEIKKDYKVVYGGICYQTEPPKKELMLRWKYGIQREALKVEQRNKNKYLSFLTLNFLIHKSVFESIKFNEDIPNLRHEDTLFSYNLMLAKIPIAHIDNTILHKGLDPFEIAINKEHESLVALKNLLDSNLISKDYLKIATLYNTLKQLKVKSLFAFCYNVFKKYFIKNLSSSNPSLFVFDLYRIFYLCKL
jgi:hypothetical protein